MKKIVILFFLTGIIFNLYAQKGKETELCIYANLAQAKEIPKKIVIESWGLGNYSSKMDTAKIINKTLNFYIAIFEPTFFDVCFYSKSGQRSSVKFWAVPSSKYELIYDEQLNLKLKTPDQFKDLIAISFLEKEIIKIQHQSDSLIKNISYENRKINDVENDISKIRDSFDRITDDVFYKEIIQSKPNSALGLFALCKYADRPYGNQRIKAQPEMIEALLDKFDLSIKNLPSAKTLKNKLILSTQLAIGKSMKSVSLPDTLGNVKSLKDFFGGYLLVDFWASWCIPCRAENPSLIKYFNKYGKQGFKIISITRDNRNSKIKWLQALKQDKINSWLQLSDFDDIAQKSFNIRFIPANYLVDPKGIIIGRDLRGEELEAALFKIYKN